MFIKLSSAIFLGMLFLLPLSASSQTSLYLGPHLGIQKSDGAEDANYLVGATLRMKVMPILGLEGDLGYRQEKYGSGAVTVRNWPLTVTGLLYPLPMIYGGIGGGWYNTTFDYNNTYNDAGFDDETTNEFGWHLAAGLEVSASPQFKLVGDVRYVFLDYKFKELPEAFLTGQKSDF